MAVRTKTPGLYETDETAWLEKSARLLKQKRFDEIDRRQLAEYLQDMARRDRREVMSRLTVLLTHMLKWEFQASHRTGSWRATISAQRDELQDLLESKTLRNHAEESLVRAYERAVEYASIETRMDEEDFPSRCPYTLNQLLQKE